MDWIILISSGVFEAVWATALGHSNGLRRLRPTIIFIVASLLSLGGLTYAMKSIPTGTAYTVWAAIGAVATTLWALGTGSEKANALKVASLAGIIVCVVGLKVIA